MASNPFDQFDNTSNSANPFDKFDPKSNTKGDYSIGDIAGGIGSNAAEMISSLPGYFGGGLTYLGTLAATGNPEAAKAVKQATEEEWQKKFGWNVESPFAKQFKQDLQEGFEGLAEAGGKGTKATAETFLGPMSKQNQIAAEELGKFGINAELAGAGPAALIHGLHTTAPHIPENKGIEVREPVKEEVTKASTENPFNQFDIPHQQEMFPQNPYDVGGHVTAAEEGHPNTIDNPQGDMFGGKDLEAAQETPPVTTKEEVPPTLEKAPPENTQMQEAFKQAQIEKAHSDAEAEAARIKEAQLDTIQEQQHAVDAGELDYQHSKDQIGDASLMDKPSTITMRGLLRMGDTEGALRQIIDNHPSEMYRQMASYLSDKLDGLKMSIRDEPTLKLGDRDVTGYYDPNTHEVVLSGLGATSPHTVLHEVAHAVTSRFIQLRPNDVRVMGIKDIFNRLTQNAGLQEKFPGISNTREFVAEAFSNPKVQEFLKTQQVNTKSAWQRFVDSVKSILGIDRGSSTSNAFDHVIDLSKQIVEASQKETNKSLLEQAGVPNKLRDLMATKPKDINQEVATDGVVKEVIKDIPGLQKIQNEFDFTLKSPEEIKQMALETGDIKGGKLQTLFNNLDSGGLMASLRHDNNPIVKYTYSFVDHAVKSYEKLVRDNLTNKKNGLRTLLQDLNAEEYTKLHMQLTLDEGQTVRSGMDLAKMGWMEKMIQTHQRFRELDDKIFDMANDVRKQLGLEPMTKRIGHLAGRFLGDFYHDVLDEKGDPVMRITGQTSWGAQKIADFYKEKHPEWTVGEQKYNKIKSSREADRFQGFREIMNYVSKNDGAVKKALDTLDEFNKNAAIGYLNATRHAEFKKARAGGVWGSEGNKPWLDAKANAEAGFKGHLAYLDTTFKWLEMQKASENIRKIVDDKDIIDKQPNAVAWSRAYLDHALHRNQGWMADFANNLINSVGELAFVPNTDKVKSVKNLFDKNVPITTAPGHTNLNRILNGIGSAEMRIWMGLGNIPFTFKHFMLPFQKMPAMLAYLKTHGNIDGSIMLGALKSLDSYHKYILDKDTMDSFQKEASKYAEENNIFNVDLADISGKVRGSKTTETLGRLAGANFKIPEHFVRGQAFFMYAHLLKDSGMSTEAALSSAEHLTKFLYTDYNPHEAPRFTAKAGWIGQLATQVSRFKFNEYSQLGFFNRERNVPELNKILANTPLMIHIASLMAFTGVTGMIGFKAMDEAYASFMKWIMKKPDNLLAVLQRSNASDMVKYGLFAKLGIDSKINEAELLPSPFPTTTAEISQMGLAAKAIYYQDQWHAKQLALSMIPSTLRGEIENRWFTEPPNPNDTQHQGMRLYINPNTGEGRVWRDENTQMLRRFGYHTTAETNETNNSYAARRIMGDNRDLAEHVLERAKGQIASGVDPKTNPQVYQELAREYMKYQQEGQPDFSSELTKYMMSRNMSQRQQMELKASGDKLGNSPQILQQFRGK